MSIRLKNLLVDKTSSGSLAIPVRERALNMLHSLPLKRSERVATLHSIACNFEIGLYLVQDCTL